MKHFKPDPAETNHDRRAWLAYMLASARARGERAGRVRQMRRELAQLEAEAACYGWHSEAGRSDLNAVDRAA